MTTPQEQTGGPAVFHTPRVSRYAVRVWCAGGCFLFLACALACMVAPFKARAVYGPDLEFRAIAARDSFDEVIWSDPDERQPVCPIAVHLPGGDLGDEQLRSPQALLALGAVVRYDDNAKKPRAMALELTRGAATLDTTHRDDRITSLRVRVTGPTDLTIRGKRLTLPLAKADLIGALGQPAQMIE